MTVPSTSTLPSICLSHSTLHFSTITCSLLYSGIKGVDPDNGSVRGSVKGSVKGSVRGGGGGGGGGGGTVKSGRSGLGSKGQGLGLALDAPGQGLAVPLTVGGSVGGSYSPPPMRGVDESYTDSRSTLSPGSFGGAAGGTGLGSGLGTGLGTGLGFLTPPRVTVPEDQMAAAAPAETSFISQVRHILSLLAYTQAHPPAPPHVHSYAHPLAIPLAHNLIHTHSHPFTLIHTLT